MRKTLTVTSALLLIAALLGLAVGAGLSANNITIRLPSGGAGGEAADDISWDVPPWKCCDVPACTSRDIPPSCFCADLVDSCDGCKDCVAAAGSRYMCADMYRTYPPPACTERLERPWRAATTPDAPSPAPPSATATTPWRSAPPRAGSASRWTAPTLPATAASTPTPARRGPASMENAASVPTLPDDVLATVLGRLPARSLAASRCVCQA
ncbi:hypothetical protein BAE44_0024443 [Dichanthelium oligosanthes]|uniref:Bowman-Birk serine protease inhibitors family domain-containing protein n=1 Tax=Dichanthelium oligosanthes TaxID=888268 RepID=A0A1E5UNT8_9POAL|nr:hypothetical protein BAE44_0024443 [Dichanthelium oligosanthes]